MSVSETSVTMSLLDESDIDMATGAILNELEAGKNDSVQDMIGKINELITRLGAESPNTDRTPGSDASASFVTDASSEAVVQHRGRGRSRAVTTRRNDRSATKKRVTPYDMWKLKNKPPPKPKALKLTEAQRNATIERLLRSKTNKELDSAQTFEALTAEEQGIGQPDTSRTKEQNDKLSGYVPIHKRYESVIEKAKRKKLEIERARENQELQPCTFKPDMGASNKTFRPGQKFKQPAGTVYERCNEYGQMKQYRAARRRQWQAKIEEKELTFEPQLNPNTRRILEKRSDLRQSVRERTRKFRVLKNAQDAGHEEETFAPKINARSRRLARQGKVYNRLYQSAKQSEESLIGKINDYYDETVNPQFDRPAVLKNKVRNGKGAVTNRERTLRRQGVLVPQGEYHENVIQWEEDLGFLRAALAMD